jgi:hypothetical protein
MNPAELKHSQAPLAAPLLVAGVTPLPILEPALRNSPGLIVSLTGFPMAPVAFFGTRRVLYEGGALGLCFDRYIFGLTGTAGSTLIQL